jgi:hypothetical protein
LTQPGPHWIEEGVDAPLNHRRQVQHCRSPRVLPYTFLGCTALQSTPSGLRQIPHTELSPYLLHADLSNLGRPDFFERGELHRREVQAERAGFWRATLTLLEGNTWLTPAGTALRQEQQLKNIEWLQGVVERFGFAG